MHNPKYSSKRIALDSGDLLLLYTDGLFEAHNVNNEEFGEEGIAHFISENYNKNVDDIIADLLQTAKRFAGQFNDDVTIIALKLD
jgi:serine phosphatase RsbU (regulator of sigma subunit)